MIDVATIFLFFGVPVSLVALGYGAMLLHERQARTIGATIELDPSRSGQSSASVTPSDLPDLIRALFKTLDSLDTDEQEARTRGRPANPRPEADVD